MALNIADIVKDHAKQRPDHTAIEDGDYRISYEEFDTRVSDTAARLRAKGVGIGDVVAVTFPDSAALLIILFALARAGAIILPIHSYLRQRERVQQMSGHLVKWVVTAEKNANWCGIERIKIRDVCPQQISDEKIAQSFEEPDLPVGHPLFIAASSGTTGAPKAFLMNHEQMDAENRQAAHCLDWNAGERYVALHGATDFWGCEDCLTVLRLGATVVINRTQTHAEFIDFTKRREITAVTLTPAYLNGLLHAARSMTRAFPTVRSMAVGSAPVSPQDRLLARQRLTPYFIEVYGTNETAWLAMSLPVDQDAYPESVGRIITGAEAQVVDVDHRPLPHEQIGLLRFRGPSVLIERYLDSEATAQAFRDGWFYPGDLAALNAQGYLFLKGRSDDVINNQGAMFYPIEIENVLLSHPAVTDAAVFGWPDNRRGEIPIAYLVTKEPATQKSIRRHCAKYLSHYKLPETISFIAEMPRNSAGKIQKRRLKELFEGLPKCE